MSGRSRISPPPSSPDLFNAISSPGSGSGPTPCGSPDGRTIARSGRGPAPVNLSARQAKAAGLLTSGTYGRPSFTLSTRAALLSSLASKLRASTASLGSTLYRLTWKARTTPSGRRICALRASARPISDNGSTLPGLPDGEARAGWVTPSARDWKDNTPAILESERGDGRSRLDQLPRQAFLAGWPTPVVRDERNSLGDGTNPRDLPGRRSSRAGRRRTRDRRTTRTPLAERRAEVKAKATNGNGFGLTLGMAATLAGWPTPTAEDGRRGIDAAEAAGYRTPAVASGRPGRPGPVNGRWSSCGLDSLPGP